MPVIEVGIQPDVFAGRGRGGNEKTIIAQAAEVQIFALNPAASAPIAGR